MIGLLFHVNEAEKEEKTRERERERWWKGRKDLIQSENNMSETKRRKVKEKCLILFEK